MRFAVCSDEPYQINEFIVSLLKKHGHTVEPFGSLCSNREESFVRVAREAALSIRMGRCQEGIFFCYSGTGIAIAANKIPGIRAALCTDAETARIARIYNHANVLALSNRLLSQDIAKEILAVWLKTSHQEEGASGVDELQALERDFLKS